MKKYIVFGSITLLLSVGVTYIMGFTTKQDKKIGWVNLSKMYNEFSFKKELEAKLTKTQQARKNILDSLEFSIKVLAKQIEAEGQQDRKKIALYEVQREEYMTKKNQFDEDNSMMQKDYNEQILAQMNQYVKDFGAANGYSFILGADGTGTIMYAEEGKDITAEVSDFINEKYKGKTK